jgi:hypothetical protein
MEEVSMSMWSGGCYEVFIENCHIEKFTGNVSMRIELEGDILTAMEIE